MNSFINIYSQAYGKHVTAWLQIPPPPPHHPQFVAGNWKKSVQSSFLVHIYCQNKLGGQILRNADKKCWFLWEFCNSVDA